VERDQFDIFLQRCAKEVNTNSEFGRDGAREIAEEICPACFNNIPQASRHCPHCGHFQSIPDGVTGTFKPKTIIRKNLAITMLAMDGGVEIENKSYIRLHIKIQNLTQKRVHISLTYVDSVLIDVSGRQHSPVEADEFTEDPRENVFPTWFYIYPDAFRDGVLLFREISMPLQRVIICAMHQENEDELFVFDLNIPPEMPDALKD